MSELDSASVEIKLAVDLIMILEDNNIDPAIALDALAIVQQDCQRKLAQKQSMTKLTRVRVKLQSSASEDD
jgi:hypothetical protein